MVTVRLKWCQMSALQTVDDGSVLQGPDVLFGLVKARRILNFGWRALHQLDEVVTINFVHYAKHTPAVVTDPFQVLPFAGIRLGCRSEERMGTE